MPNQFNMKTQKLLLIFISIFILSNSLTAENPDKKLSKEMLKKVSDAVQLSQDQTLKITAAAQDYEKLMIKHIEKKENNSREIMDDALLAYRNKLDSILTIEQQDTIAKFHNRLIIEKVKKYNKK